MDKIFRSWMVESFNSESSKVECCSYIFTFSSISTNFCVEYIDNNVLTEIEKLLFSGVLQRPAFRTSTYYTYYSARVTFTVLQYYIICCRTKHMEYKDITHTLFIITTVVKKLKNKQDKKRNWNLLNSKSY